MNVLVLGSGGREHSFAWKINQSPLCDHLYVAPGNAGTADIAVNLELDISDFDAVHAAVIKHEIHLLVVGPEVPLVNGITDYFHRHMPGLMVIGPKKEGAMLEGSKAFAKHFMMENEIPTASYLEVTRETLKQGISHLEKNSGPYVLKADGLAAGKGVIITESKEEAITLLEEMLDGKFGQASERVVIEQFLSGIEFSVFILTDGRYYSLLPIAKDYKRIGEGDTGLNTGGMGAVSPVPFVDRSMMEKVKKRIILPTLEGLQKRNIDYRGFIFFGLINVDGDPYVIEYNCRMGDPETQVVIPRLQNDLMELFIALFEDDLYEIRIQSADQFASTVVLVSGGYPGNYEKGKSIHGMDEVLHSLIFQAGTRKEEGTTLTNGGRVLAITSFGDTIEDARDVSLKNAESIQFENKYFRKDIGFDLVSNT
jgi:phosphoribosylamine--glycine ligase